ncbi:MAG: LiaF-related protein [Candidatus Pacebacteria bacterium]|nr:LiaF-related protein [Candidatus Paceibacterota bacterium]
MMKVILGLFLILIGINILTGISFFNYIFAALIIYIGVRMIFGKKQEYRNDKTLSHEDVLNEVFVFSPINKAVESGNFKGGDVVMIFSGGQIDLSQAKTSSKVIDMEIATIFGGIKLIIPKEWKVNFQGVSIIGGSTNNSAAEGDVILNIKGVTIMGGVEISN